MISNTRLIGRRVISTPVVSPACRVSARFQAIQARLYITWLAVQTIRVAVAQFQKQLSDEQRARFNTLQLAATP